MVHSLPSLYFGLLTSNHEVLYKSFSNSEIKSEILSEKQTKKNIQTDYFNFGNQSALNNTHLRPSVSYVTHANIN